MNIYVMNLDSSLKRWLDIKKQAEKYNLNLIRVKPVTFTDPHFLSLRESWDVKYSCELSLQLTVTRISEKENKPFLLLEDDIYFDEDPTNILEKIETLPDDFLLAYIGCYIREHPGTIENYNNYFKEFKGSHMIWSFGSVVINPKEFQKVCECWKVGKVQAIDGHVSLNHVGKDRCFVSNKMIAWQSGDINNSIHGGFQFEKMKDLSISLLDKYSK